MTGTCDVAVAFFTRASQLAQELDGLARMVFPAGGLWIAWPKKSSGVSTDITDHVVREFALSRALVDNRCAPSMRRGLHCGWSGVARSGDDGGRPAMTRAATRWRTCAGATILMPGRSMLGPRLHSGRQPRPR